MRCTKKYHLQPCVSALAMSSQMFKRKIGAGHENKLKGNKIIEETPRMCTHTRTHTQGDLLLFCDADLLAGAGKIFRLRSPRSMNFSRKPSKRPFWQFGNVALLGLSTSSSLCVSRNCSKLIQFAESHEGINGNPTTNVKFAINSQKCAWH